jgi:hypothetical protein
VKSLQEWGFKELKRRGIHGKLPEDLIQGFEQKLSRRSSSIIWFSIGGKVDDLQHSFCSIALTVATTKQSEFWKIVRQTTLQNLVLQAQQTQTTCSKGGWLIGHVIAQHEAGQMIEILNVLEKYGLAWLRSSDNS